MIPSLCPIPKPKTLAFTKVILQFVYCVWLAVEEGNTSKNDCTFLKILYSWSEIFLVSEFVGECRWVGGLDGRWDLNKTAVMNPWCFQWSKVSKIYSVSNSADLLNKDRNECTYQTLIICNAEFTYLSVRKGLNKMSQEWSNCLKTWTTLWLWKKTWTVCDCERESHSQGESTHMHPSSCVVKHTFHL